MDCNVISISLQTGNQSADIFALQSQLVSLQIIIIQLRSVERLMAIQRTCDSMHWSPLSANRLVAS